MPKNERSVPAGNFIATIAKNVDNKKLTDAEFRQIFRDTLPIVIYDGCLGFETASGTMLYEEVMNFMAMFRELELSNHTSITFSKDSEHMEEKWRITIAMKGFSKFLLISSFEDGMLREWNRYFDLSRLSA